MTLASFLFGLAICLSTTSVSLAATLEVDDSNQVRDVLSSRSQVVLKPTMRFAVQRHSSRTVSKQGMLATWAGDCATTIGTERYFYGDARSKGLKEGDAVAAFTESGPDRLPFKAFIVGKEFEEQGGGSSTIYSIKDQPQYLVKIPKNTKIAYLAGGTAAQELAAVMAAFEQEATMQTWLQQRAGIPAPPAWYTKARIFRDTDSGRPAVRINCPIMIKKKINRYNLKDFPAPDSGPFRKIAVYQAVIITLKLLRYTISSTDNDHIWDIWMGKPRNFAFGTYKIGQEPETMVVDADLIPEEPAYFNRVELLSQFLKNLGNIGDFEPTKGLIGKLGYPPKGCEAFVDMSHAKTAVIAAALADPRQVRDCNVAIREAIGELEKQVTQFKRDLHATRRYLSDNLVIAWIRGDLDYTFTMDKPARMGRRVERTYHMRQTSATEAQVDYYHDRKKKKKGKDSYLLDTTGSIIKAEHDGKKYHIVVSLKKIIHENTTGDRPRYQEHRLELLPRTREDFDDFLHLLQFIFSKIPIKKQEADDDDDGW